jgi:putative DNA primase/helicase
MLIQKLNCGCIGILHFAKDPANKKPVDRIMNSRAFSDVARMNLAAAMDEETQECVFTRVKTNIAPLGGGFKYRIEQTQWNNGKGEVIETQYIRWIEEIQSQNPRAIFAAVSYNPKKKDLPEGLPGTDRLEAAKSWLLNLLTQEPVSVKALPSLTQNAGLNWSVVDTAKRILERTGKVKTGPIGYGGQHFLQIIG